MKKFSTLNTLIFMMLFSWISGASAESTPYVSPGIKLNYLPGKGISLGAKLSIGVINDETFVNMTLGTQKLLNKNTDYSFRFVEVQGGTSTPYNKSTSLISGGGLGIMIHNSNGQKSISPKLNLFSGLLMFGEINVYLDEQKKLTGNIGLEGVVPLPAKKVDTDKWVTD
ncbi:MAG: hypothetical protein Kow00108_16270 [Calditrichia bacterium]